MTSTTKLRSLYRHDQAVQTARTPALSPSLSPSRLPVVRPPALHPRVTVLPPSTSTRADGGSGYPYQSGATTRRTLGWNPSRLGPTGVLWGSIDILRARCRDEVRNNPWAASAADTFQAQTVGTGIKPHWEISNPAVKLQIETEFARWARDTNFYSLQATAVREIFEGGEVFARRHIRPASWHKRIPLDIQLLEAEQCPVFLSAVSGGFGAPPSNSIRTGIEFDSYNRVVAYHMYKENPGEAMFYPLTGLQYVRLPAADIFHCFEPLRAGLLRGVPRLSVVLNTLHELDKYLDASVVSKQIQTMFAGFIKKVDPGSDIVPTDGSALDTYNNQAWTPPSVQQGKMEPGSLQILLEGEDITFPSLPQNSDIETFLRVCLHQLAVGIGITYEQLTGDLKGVNLSSIRAGILDFRRKCEQFQLNVIVSRLLHPIVAHWWLPEAVLAGVLDLPGYFTDPGQYENITWRTPGWAWIDPLKDAQANQLNVRSGFASRDSICAESGEDSTTIDQQQINDNKRADAAGLTYESDARVVLTRGEKVTPEGEEDEGVPEKDAVSSGKPGSGSGSGSDNF